MPRIVATEVVSGRFSPLIPIRLQVGDAVLEEEVLAQVDSGADASIIPAELLEPLGIACESLQRIPGGGQGPGGNLEIRLAAGAIHWGSYWMCDHFAVAEPGKLPEPLLGRADFFQRFVVRFLWHRSPPCFDIDPVA